MKKAKSAQKPKAKNKKSKKQVKKARGLKNRIKTVASGLIEKVESLVDFSNDIVKAIKIDHDALREFISVLKDTDQPMDKRRRAFTSFKSLLISHSKSEEKAVYEKLMEMSGKELHIKTAEGFVEHHLADFLIARIEGVEDALEWSAHANVLAEIVAHHLDEEESDLLPLVRKQASASENMDMLSDFLSLRGKSQTDVNQKNAGVLDDAK